jgi:plastocyanin
MKKTIIIGMIFVGIIIISGCTGPKLTQVPQPTSNGVPNATVDIKVFAFDPSTITVPRGTTVIWTNRDSASHTVTGDIFGSGSIPQNGEYSHTFQDAGTFDYHCKIHPNMQGKVIVT